jgi:uncharacterized protein (DUF362 family)
MKAGGKIVLTPQPVIMIKPNICLIKSYETGATVDPFIVKCLVDWLLDNYDVQRIIIGEADATVLSIDIAFKVLGWEEVFRHYPRVKLQNLSRDETVAVKLNGRYFAELNMPRSMMEANYVISVGKLKTHGMTGVTGILKNQYGANPIKYKAQYHARLDDVICDLTAARVPDLCLVDGIIAMEGGTGPVNGIPRAAGLLVAGDDAVAVDDACARIMGFKPRHISHLCQARKRKIGSDRYEVFGREIGEVAARFEFTPGWKKAITRIYRNKWLHAAFGRKKKKTSTGQV